MKLFKQDYSNRTDRLIKQMQELDLDAQQTGSGWAKVMDACLAVEAALERSEYPTRWDPKAARALMRAIGNRALASGLPFFTRPAGVGQ